MAEKKTRARRTSKSKVAAIQMIALSTLAEAAENGMTVAFESVKPLVEAGHAEINPTYGVNGVAEDGTCMVRVTQAGYEQVTIDNLGDVEAPAEVEQTPTSMFTESEPAVELIEKPQVTLHKVAVKNGFEITDALPVPPVTGRGRGTGGSKYPFALLEVGQSFFVSDDLGGEHGAARKMGSAVSIANKRFAGERKFIVRAVDENGSTGARIWRVEVTA